MANPRPPIIGSFEDIGEHVAKNVAKIPTDIIGKALESVGVTTGGGGKTQQGGTQNLPPETQAQGSNWQQLSQTHDEKLKKTIARNALQELSSKAPETQQSIQEKQKKEEEEKKAQKDKQEKKDQMAALPKMSAKQARGNLHGMKSKKGGGANELSKNVKAE